MPRRPARQGDANGDASVDYVLPGGALDLAGIRVGDVLLQVWGGWKSEARARHRSRLQGGDVRAQRTAARGAPSSQKRRAWEGCGIGAGREKEGRTK